MAPTQTTTLRVPVELRDEIAHLAEQENTTLLAVVTKAIHRLKQDQWWATVRHQLDSMTPEDVAGHQDETDMLDSTAADGLSVH